MRYCYFVSVDIHPHLLHTEHFVSDYAVIPCAVTMHRQMIFLSAPASCHQVVMWQEPTIHDVLCISAQLYGDML